MTSHHIAAGRGPGRLAAAGFLAVSAGVGLCSSTEAPSALFSNYQSDGTEISVAAHSASLRASANSPTNKTPTGAVLARSGNSASLLPVSEPAFNPGMKLISRELRVLASSGDASHVSDSNYDSFWRSSGVPATLSFDLSPIDPANRQNILLAWYNDLTYGFDHAVFKAVGYNNLGSYTIEGNVAAGGGPVPTVGWVVLTAVQNNTLHSREHELWIAGYNWLRLNATASDGSPGNSDIAIKVDIYDASHGVTDGWFFVGDSITANAMGHRNVSAGAGGSFSNLVEEVSGVTPPQENAGMGGWTSASWIPYLPNYLKIFLAGT